MTVEAVEAVYLILEAEEVVGPQKPEAVVEGEQNLVVAVAAAVAAAAAADNTAGNTRHNFDTHPTLRMDLGLSYIENTCGCSLRQSGLSPVQLGKLRQHQWQVWHWQRDSWVSAEKSSSRNCRRPPRNSHPHNGNDRAHTRQHGDHLHHTTVVVVAAAP